MSPKKPFPLFLRCTQRCTFSAGLWQSWKKEKESVLIPQNVPEHQDLRAASLLEVSLLRLPLLLSNYLNNPFCLSEFINNLFWEIYFGSDCRKIHVLRPEHHIHFLFGLRAWYPIRRQFNKMSKLEENSSSRHIARLNHISFTLV